MDFEQSNTTKFSDTKKTARDFLANVNPFRSIIYYCFSPTSYAYINSLVVVTIKAIISNKPLFVISNLLRNRRSLGYFQKI